MTQRGLILWVCASVCVPIGCKEKNSETDEVSQVGEACVPETVEDGVRCADGLACEPTATAQTYVCGQRIEIRGKVVDALTSAPIAGAVVAALDETGAPIGNAVRTDTEGNYVLPASARRVPDGSVDPSAAWTMFANASLYQVFPGGLRPALPVDTSQTTDETDEDDHVVTVIENPTTTVALLPLPGDQRGITIEGTVGGSTPGGTLVVAEGGATPAPYTVADAAGHYVLFNVTQTAGEVFAYRAGAEFESRPFSSDSVLTEFDLVAVERDPGSMARVEGSINIVNAPGGAATSVVLVPTSVYNMGLERGPVPFGLRAPTPPTAPSLTGAFSIVGVPSGDYQVLAAFENDDLVRDPDTSIAGTALQEISVGDSGVATVPESFKITEALAVISPGVDRPEEISDPTPDFVWQDDSSEDRYELRVYDSFGELVWEVLDVPGVSGSETVTVTYAGPDLEVGQYYQFRATSLRETPTKTTPITRTEDLRGVFVLSEPQQ